MSIQDKIKDLEQQVSIGFLKKMYVLENQQKNLRDRITFGIKGNLYALWLIFMCDD